MEPYTFSVVNGLAGLVFDYFIDPFVNESYRRCLHLFHRHPEKRNKEDAFKFPGQSKVGNI